MIHSPFDFFVASYVAKKILLGDIAWQLWICVKYREQLCFRIFWWEVHNIAANI